MLYHTTIYRAESFAILKALQVTQMYHTIVIHSDCLQVVKTVSELLLIVQQEANRENWLPEECRQFCYGEICKDWSWILRESNEWLVRKLLTRLVLGRFNELVKKSKDIYLVIMMLLILRIYFKKDHIQIKHIDAHTGNFFNEHVDILAKEVCLKAKGHKLKRLEKKYQDFLLNADTMYDPTVSENAKENT